MNEHTSQPLSQRLQDAGFRIDHGTRWKKDENETWLIMPHSGDEGIPAYTFSELWGVLPDRLNGYWKILLNSYAGYVHKLDHDGIRDSLYGFDHESPAEAVGLLLEWLIEHKHMEVEG